MMGRLRSVYGTPFDLWPGITKAPEVSHRSPSSRARQTKSVTSSSSTGRKELTASSTSKDAVYLQGVVQASKVHDADYKD